MDKEKTKLSKKLPTAQKRNIQNKIRNLRNRSFKSKIRTAIKAFNDSLKNDNFTLLKNQLDDAFSLLDKSTKKNIFKKNKTNKIKSKLSLVYKNKTKASAAKS